MGLGGEGSPPALEMLTLHRPEASELVAPIKSGAEFLCLPRTDGK